MGLPALGQQQTYDRGVLNADDSNTFFHVQACVEVPPHVRKRQQPVFASATLPQLCHPRPRILGNSQCLIAWYTDL